MEKVYKTMKSVGAGCIVLGIITLVVGLSVGIISIVSGARLLKNKSEVTF